MSDRLLLSFRPEGPGRPRQARWKWLHWPALAFRVRAQVPPSRNLDVFEDLVLRLGLAGYLWPDEIAEMTGLAPDLVTLIIGQLNQRGLLDPSGPTPRGRAAIDSEDRPDAAESALGWMLRCQLSGQVMPLFWDGDLPPGTAHGIAPIDLPALSQGSGVGSQRDFHLAMRHWRGLLRLSDRSDRSEGNEAEYDSQEFPLDADEQVPVPADPDADAEESASRRAAPPLQMNDALLWSEQQLALEVIEGAAQAVAVRVLMYLPGAPRSIAPDLRNQDRDLDGVLLRHPLGIPGGDWFRQCLAARLPELRSSAGAIRTWARDARDQRSKSLRGNGITIEDLGTLGRQRSHDLFGEIESLDEALATPMAFLGEALLLAEKRPVHAGDVRSRTSKVLEIICDTWICRFGKHREDPRVWAKTHEGRKASVRAAALRLGISSVSPAMLDPDRDGLIQAVAGKGNLRDRLVLVLVDAATAPAMVHPFALALRRHPTLLEELDQIRNTRNRSIHHRRSQALERDDHTAASALVELVQRCLGAMLSGWRDALQPAEETIPLEL